MRIEVVLKEGAKAKYMAELTETDLLMLTELMAETGGHVQSLPRENMLRRFCESAHREMTDAWSLVQMWKKNKDKAPKDVFIRA
jgi:hypothetical protein